jgi:hypothetical protein
VTETITTEADDQASSGSSAPEDAQVTRRPLLHTVTLVVAMVGVVVAGAGLVWGTRPLATPTQDCGTSFSFLLDGRLNEYVDPDNPPSGTTASEAKANNNDPCQERAANQARPAAWLVMGGTLVALVAALIEGGVRVYQWMGLARPRPPRTRRGSSFRLRS